MQLGWGQECCLRCIDVNRYQSSWQLHRPMSICGTMGAMSRKKVLLPYAGPDDDAEVCCPWILGAPLAESDPPDLARGFAALADPARLRLFSLIAAQPAGEVCACAL